MSSSKPSPWQPFLAPARPTPPSGELWQWSAENNHLGRWLGECFCWIPRHSDFRDPLYAVVSSRLGRHPHRRPHWFQMLRHVMEIASSDKATLVTPEKTAAFSWVTHACDVFRQPMFPIAVADWDEDVDRWLERIEESPPERIMISPPLNSDHALSSFPRRDVASIACPSRIFAPHVSKGGNIDQLLHRRLLDDSFAPASVWVGVDPSSKASKRLIDSGAVGWLRSQPDSPDQYADTQIPDNVYDFESFITARGDQGVWSYLTHCTRERSGPWPTQSEKAYRDQLVLDSRQDCGGPIDSLLRIVQSQHIEGGNRVTRGPDRVVCFSARHISDLLQDRTFRSHLGRWDYEPFGISIRKDALIAKGATEVIYGDDQTMRSLRTEQQPFFQSCGSSTDWTGEAEWRVLGNVDLKDIGPSDAFIFVPSVPDACRVSRFSPWPIVVITV